MTSVEQLLASTVRKPVAFNRHVLGREHQSVPGGYTEKQIEICDSLSRCRKTCVQAAHGTGKTHLAAGIGLHYLYTHVDSTVLLISPSYPQLKNVLWAELRKSFVNAKVTLPGRLLKSPLKLEIGDKWHLLGFSADTSPEKLSGHHGEHVFVVVDESTDEAYTEDVMAALDGLNASTYLFLGNPIRHGPFKTLCDRADGAAVNKIVISAFDSPHAALERSPVGLADAGYIRNARAEWGETDPRYIARVLGQFNDDDDFALIPSAWLDRCAEPVQDGDHGPRVLSVDLSGGTGRGDLSAIVVRDRDQVLTMDWSARWKYPEGVAERVQEVAREYAIPGGQIIFDGAGLGTGFGWILANQFGLPNAWGYVGGETGGRYATNFRGACALAFRDRLDPMRNKQHFHIPARFLDELRPEVRELRYELAGRDQVKLEPKDQLRKRLGRSPDLLDAILMGFARA